jgi:hypothetical protein
MSNNQPSNLPTDIFDKWRKACKKKDPSTWNVMVPTPVSKKAADFSVLFSDPIIPLIPNSKLHICYRKDIWRLVFPKIAEDLIDIDVFRDNVMKSVGGFLVNHFPLTKDIAKSVQISIPQNEIVVKKDQYGHYPEISMRPTFSGPQDVVDEFLQSFRTTQGGCEFYWKGNFLKSKTNGKITGIRLLNISYNLPYKFSGGQPIAYQEYTLL